jgi:polyhydroxybutyrate depolymerase
MVYLLLVGITFLILVLLVVGVWASAFLRRPPETGKQTIEVNGESRTYYIRWPARIRESHPLLLAFHGGFGNAMFYEKQTNFFRSEAMRDYVVVFPEAPDGWVDARPERGGSRKDLDFVDTLLDHLLLYPEVNPRRVFGVGSSNGGLMLFRVATDLPEQRFAGFASALAQMPVEAVEKVRPGPPAPFLLAHGRRDYVMPYDGGELIKAKSAGGDPSGHRGAGAGGTVISALENLEFWIERNRASHTPERTSLGKAPRLIEMFDFPAQPGGAPVRYMEIENWGHRWPRWEAKPEEGIEAFDVAEVIHDFFATLSLPEERLDRETPESEPGAHAAQG